MLCHLFCAIITRVETQIRPPSQEDIQITESIGKAGSLIGVSLLDHLIIGEKNYTSLREIQAVTFE